VEGPTPAIKDSARQHSGGRAGNDHKINRQDFGVSWSRALDAGGVVVGDEVTITIDLQLVKRSAASN